MGEGQDERHAGQRHRDGGTSPQEAAPLARDRVVYLGREALVYLQP